MTPSYLYSKFSQEDGSSAQGLFQLQAVFAPSTSERPPENLHVNHKASLAHPSTPSDPAFSPATPSSSNRLLSALPLPVPSEQTWPGTGGMTD